MNSVQNLGGVLDVLADVADFLDNYVDVDDGDYGEPTPNRAMRLHTAVSNAIEVIERLQRGTSK